MRNIFFAACAMLAVAVFGAETAAAQTWRVSETQGLVRVSQPGRAPADAQPAQTLAVGSTVTTGANSRATLENGAQRVVMSANSRMTIAPDSTDAMTRIIQDLGAALFQVDRRQTPHFRVETPLLAAVVKGTTFTVTAGGAQDMVHVSEGLVEVQANESGAVNDVPAGSTARVARGAPGQIAVAQPSPACKRRRNRGGR